jgi:hypothetical protein
MEEANSDGENHSKSKSNAMNSNEGQSKPKRQMKTPFQLQTLENAYASLCTSSLSLSMFYLFFFSIFLLAFVLVDLF